MLDITIPDSEVYDEEGNKFFTVRGTTLRLEHSLVSLSKWESEHKKPFLSRKQMTREETLSYIKCMTITQNVDPVIYSIIPESLFEEVANYIEHPMTATTFSKEEAKKKATNTEIITSEIIYYWMIALQIPVEFQKWHLNRLLTLINVCNLKNQPKKKMNRSDVYARNKALNAARRRALNSTG